MVSTKIPLLKVLSIEDPKKSISKLTSSGSKNIINQINWKEFPHLIDVQLSIGYNGQDLFLYYAVSNEHIRSIYRKDQDPVWQDSCVEFFVKEGNGYHNFEFNSLGYCLSAFGLDRNNRKSLDKNSLEQILRFPSYTEDTLPSEQVLSSWSLMVVIPLSLIGLKAGDTFYANFYKCGDRTLVPHYISLAPIGTENPDFHQSAYFVPFELAL